VSTVVVGVGTNLGAREAAIHAARRLLDARPGVEVAAVSPIYETPPVGPPQGDFLNAAFRLETELSPSELLRVLLKTESRLGRMRTPAQRWGPRSVDLDLLWDARGPYESSELRVPHPELLHRGFALGPLLDVVPDLETRFGRALDSLGGRPTPWERAAIVNEAGLGRRIEAEADHLPDACALCLTSGDPLGRPWSTRHVTIPPSPEALAGAVRELLRTGFVLHRTTVSHCSKSQWVAQFHGVNAGISVDADVGFRTTSGSLREIRVELTIEGEPLD
jgi:2-amino-4-hydroxy-6-hydroxymethyldihydropteridine diphosphokinase